MNLEAVSNNMDQFERQFEKPGRADGVRRAGHEQHHRGDHARRGGHRADARGGGRARPGVRGGAPRGEQRRAPEACPQATQEDDISTRLAALAREADGRERSGAGEQYARRGSTRARRIRICKIITETNARASTIFTPAPSTLRRRTRGNQLRYRPFHQGANAAQRGKRDASRAR